MASRPPGLRMSRVSKCGRGTPPLPPAPGATICPATVFNMATEIKVGVPPRGMGHERARLVRRARLLAWGGIGWHFIEFAIAVGAGMLENYKTARERLVPVLGGSEALLLSWQGVQEAVTVLCADLSPATVRIYVGTLRQVLDFAGCDPNPAKDKRVKLARREATILDPPSETAVAAIIANAPPKWRLALRVLEQTGMRAGELAKLEWADVDQANSRFRIRAGKTAAARRWVAVPEWLMEKVVETCPPDDRTPERRVFPGATRQVLGMAMREAVRRQGWSSTPRMTYGTAMPR
jgi:integrase